LLTFYFVRETVKLKLITNIRKLRKIVFCRKCGDQINTEEKFCASCGTQVSYLEFPSKKFLFNKYVLLIILALFVGWISTFNFLEENNEELDVLLFDQDVEISKQEVPIDDLANSNSTLLRELELYIEPVGYFSDPLHFDSEEMKNEDWLNLIIYTEQESAFEPTNNEILFPNQYDVFSAVAKIVCEDDEYYYYGSGTSIDNAGYVVTNLHVIDGDDGLTCIIGFPDPRSGLIREAYWATPITDDENETGLDLALLSIETPVFDLDLNIYGFYNRFINKTFPFYQESDSCLATIPQLGDHVYILGYPSLSGGALTITEGLVSSLYSASGYIITSAKISEGNSGGLAVNSRGCLVGVPTAIYADEQNESYGEIIDAEFVYSFYEAVLDDIDEYLEL
jgi:hypothetical protein